MKIETGIIVFVVGLALNGTFFIAVAWTTFRKDIAQLRKDQERDYGIARQDLKNIGDKVRQCELKLLYVAMMTCYDTDLKRSDDKRQEVLNALVRRLT